MNLKKPLTVETIRLDLQGATKEAISSPKWWIC
jgi:hypothetical protein